MKRFLAGLTALFLALPLTLAAWGFLLPAQFEETFLGELKYKIQRLKASEGRRIVLVGGSGAAFGVLGEPVEAELPGYTFVNCGMYAALGTEIMLALTEPSIREGDIVILMPEENRQTLSDFFGAALFWQGADGDFRLLRAVPRRDWGQLLAAFPRFAAEKLRYFLTEPPAPEGIYRRASFDACGGIRPAGRERNILPTRYDPATPVYLSEAGVDESFFPLANAWAARLKAKGAAVWLRLCPVNALAVAEGDAEGFYDLLSERLTFPLLGDPRESVLEAEWFYDTNFHLNAAGAQLYTRSLIRALKAELGITTPTALAVPPMPLPAGGENLAGDDSMAAYFTCAPFGEGWRVTGVERDAPALTVPTLREGKPVLAVAAGAFAGSVVERITLPPGLTLEDGCFAGAERLKEILLLSPDPAATRVGQRLLDG
ncbi:MAG: hypothetical protein ACSW8F_06135, partial [bacterium]